MDFEKNEVKASIRMEQAKRNFTKSELKIYDYIDKNPAQVLYHSLTELAEACNVGEATVLRLFRKIGYKGFQSFKFSLAKEVDALGEEDGNSYISRVKNSMLRTLEDSSTVIDEVQLDRAVDMIDSARDTVVFGVGSSSIAGLDMQNRLLRIGKNIEVVSDPHSQVMRTASMGEDTVVVAISITGSTRDTVDSVKAAKDKGARIIAITNYTKSPLTKFSECVLLSSAKESPLDSGSLVSKVAQLFVIDLICTGLSIRNSEQAERIRLDITGNITGKLY
ncbi:MurR/RpiR family transcriptional regulator [Salinicoccus carnicancri]|uniref:MurR/RpiR family transcriptional regulator n=1 Tax=Salinicoccus carnicancri TaxID=558170 RepID=UPI0002F57FD1|nr:MurR/RpiR family transcriptional regulator [Salinicoccus carnicancri]